VPRAHDVFRIPVADLLRNLGHRRAFVVRGPVTDVAVTGSSVDGEAEADLMLESLAGGAILASGTVHANWAGECRRCLGAAAGTLSSEVRELFEPGSDEEETYRLKGEEIDVAPLVRDAVLLELPLAPLCREACRGLCPDCGANRNEHDCGHEHHDRDPRWAALDQLNRAEGAQKE
jgi:uncharacterized protein